MAFRSQYRGVPELFGKNGSAGRVDPRVADKVAECDPDFESVKGGSTASKGLSLKEANKRIKEAMRLEAEMKRREAEKKKAAKKRR
jgi:hypothetical protein